MRTSLIITTYNRPDALQLVLRTVSHQTLLPDEVIIADDGSGDETRAVVAAYQAVSGIPVIHAWQEDKGFRAARVRNRAAARATGDYVIFLDGDMLLHPQCIASHLRYASKGWFLHGKRAMLSEKHTQTMLQEQKTSISPFAPGISLRTYGFHSSLLAKFFSYPSSTWYDTQSANLSMWREDLLAVNGFNEDFEGWGREDSELALRLMRSGLKKRELRFCAAAFHLDHGRDNLLMYSRETSRNQELLEGTERSDVTRCTNGIDKHLQSI